ncbi:protein NLRC3-like [Clupea harengus]|uniref:Protein NLRC3-like n=1 Tax=Clupea harengus TaxID=7950 RepID=A0A6P8F581_CLUHA|nr:protein NLRC3-like [Clupea harengus]
MRRLKANLALRYARVFEGSSTEGRARKVDDIYTDLFIVDEYTGGALKGHEACWMEQNRSRWSTCSSRVHCNDVFRIQPDCRKVLTLGVAGVGKTVSVHKFILDWAQGRANQDLAFLFPLPFRQLNVKSKRKRSLWELLQQSFPELKELDSLPTAGTVMFVFDGLDESRVRLEFQKELASDPMESSVRLDVLVASLISGHMLPAAYVWVTSRPAAANKISCFFDQVTEVRGFTDEQTERYFEKNTREPTARRIIAHVRKTKTLRVMCQLPVFCWILSVVLEEMWNREAKETPTPSIPGETASVIPLSKTTTPSVPSETSTPSTLTEIYTRFLLYQLGRRSETQEYDSRRSSVSQSLLNLGKLAFLHLEKRQLVFDAADLRACGVDDGSKNSEFSVTCTQIFKEESADQESRLYSFVHLSVQEYLAAVFTFYANRHRKPGVRQRLLGRTTFDLQKANVDRALRSEDGHLDLFLRFLLGLSLEPNQRLLRRLLPELDPCDEPVDKIVQYIHRTIRERSSHTHTHTHSAERSINLFHCLSELRDESLVQEVSRCLLQGALRAAELTQTQWSALCFLLLTAEETQTQFELKRYWASPQGLRRLLPVVRNTQRALLHQCVLMEPSCRLLASALTAGPAPLTVLDLSDNPLLDGGVKVLSAALRRAECPLHTLRLDDVGMSGEGCGPLVSALRSKVAHLRELDLSRNYIRDSGANQIALLLKDPPCRLEKLWLRDCGIREEGGAAVGLALCSNPAHLRLIDLSSNQLRDSGVRHVMTSLSDQRCRLECLRLEDCGLSDVSCTALASALQSNPSHLRELDLSNNSVGDQGAKLLRNMLTHPQSHLNNLR